MKRKTREEFTPVALYARVSSERQDVDLSVAAQLRALRDYAKKNNFLVVREYVDEAESGRIANRPQFSRMIEEARKPEAPFREILVWKFSRFTRKREHAVAFKSMLRRRGIRVTSITEHADDSPTGKLMEAIIESVDEFYSENLALEVIRGMREAASRGFWVTARPPFGYRKIYVQDGVKQRPRLEVDKEKAPVVRRIFDMALEGKSTLEITKTLNRDGIPSPKGKRWHKNTVHSILNNEVYTGTLVWGVNARDGGPPVRVNRAFPALVTKRNFRQVAALLRSRAPRIEHPRRSSSPYLLSGLARCESCRKALTASEAKGGKYTYYVCGSLLMQGRQSCQAPRLNAKRFEGLIVKNIRENILTESNIRDLVKIVDEEMDGEARDQRKRLKTIRSELDEVKVRLGRIWQVIETSDLEIADAADRIRDLRDRKEKLEAAEDEARTILKGRRVTLDKMETITAFARDMSEYLRTSELTGTRAFIRSFVREIEVRPGTATIHYTLPTPLDSPIGGGDADEVTLDGGVVMSSAHYGGLACAMLRVDNRGREGQTPGDIASIGLNGRGNGPFASVDSVELRLDDKAWSDGFGCDEAQALVFSATPPSSFLANSQHQLVATLPRLQRHRPAECPVVPSTVAPATSRDNDTERSKAMKSPMWSAIPLWGESFSFTPSGGIGGT